MYPHAVRQLVRRCDKRGTMLPVVAHRGRPARRSRFGGNVFCSSCGASREATARFCPSCGAALASAPMHAPSQSQGPPVMRAPISGSPPTAPTPSAGSTDTMPPYTPPVGQWPSTSGPGVGAPAPHRAVDNTLAWTLAFAPLIFVLLDGILLAAGIGEAFAAVSVVVAVLFNIILSWADARRVRAAGFDVSAALAVFLVPVYLFRRANRTGQKLAIPVVWCLCFVASFASAGLVGNVVGVAIDVPAVEAEISGELRDAVGVTVGVDCPSNVSPRPGSSFQCIVSGDGEKAIVDVTVQNTTGDIVWQVR